MAKNLKLNIKNTQIAEAINLSGLKGKLAKKKEEEAAAKKSPAAKLPSKTAKPEQEELPKEEAPRIKARSKSAFAEPHLEPASKEATDFTEQTSASEAAAAQGAPQAWHEEEPARMKTSAELRQEIFGDQEPATASAEEKDLP